MSENNGVWDLVKEYHGFIEKYLSYDEFEEITHEFQKYEDWRRSIWVRVCQIELASQMIGFEKEQVKGIQLIFISTILETLTSRVQHKQFPRWYKENKTRLSGVKTLKAYNEYQNIYGSSKNFKRFFTELDQETQINLIPRIQIQYDGKFAPYCFKNPQSCSVPNFDHSCVIEFNRRDCPMIHSDKIRKKAIKEFAGHLYIMRNNFVHSSRLPSFPSKLPEDFAGESVLFDFMIGYDDNEFWYANRLDIKYLHDLVMNKLPELFRDYLSAV